MGGCQRELGPLPALGGDGVSHLFAEEVGFGFLAIAQFGFNPQVLHVGDDRSKDGRAGRGTGVREAGGATVPPQQGTNIAPHIPTACDPHEAGGREHPQGPSGAPQPPCSPPHFQHPPQDTPRPKPPGPGALKCFPHLFSSSEEMVRLGKGEECETRCPGSSAPPPPPSQITPQPPPPPACGSTGDPPASPSPVGQPHVGVSVPGAGA